MQRNKLIYALADAALVVSSDYEKGGTWAGAVEQLEKLRLVPVYVRSNGETGKGLEALRRKGALPWPNPETSEALAEALGQNELSFSVREESTQAYEIPPSVLPGDDSIGSRLSDAALTPADELFAKVRELLQKITTPKTDAEVATDLQVSKSQARKCLQRLVDEGVLEKLSRPVRYRSVSSQASLFERRD
jgi:predicted Rossmann fold nucleotide-binding protein DprA/Smf involved in DNA uptake